MTPPPTPHVVIIGGGFAGLYLAKGLKRAAVQVTVIDRRNHHLFQPMLYQVAMAALNPSDIASPIRSILRNQRNAEVLLGEVTRIDPVARTVHLADGATIPYDYCAVATGARHAYFGHHEWEALAPGLKSIEDALEIRRRVLLAFERAEREPDPKLRHLYLTFVVIGGGPTGVEMAGTMTEIAQHTLPQEFRRIDSTRAHVVLLEGSERVLGAFVPQLSQRAREQLVKLGVDVRTGCKVTGIDAEGVDYETSADDGGETRDAKVVTRHRLSSKTVIWAAGVAGSVLGKSLVASAGATLDRAGRVIVLPDLSLTGHPEIAVIGDLASAMSHPVDPTRAKPTPVPGVSPGAKQMGRAAAANLLRRLEGQATEPFRYVDYGNLATVGRKAAVVDLTVPYFGALRFSGYFAWLFWLFAHIYFLIGFRNRLIVMLDWAWAYWTYERSARVVAEPPSIRQVPPPP